MKNPEEFQRYIESTIESLERDKARREQEVLKNFQHSFKWGVQSDIFKLNEEIKTMNSLKQAHEAGAAKQFMESYISSITERLLNGDFISRSSNEFHNIAERLELEVRCQVQKTFNYLIKSWCQDNQKS